MFRKKLLTLVTAVSLVTTSFSGGFVEPNVVEAANTKTITITKDDWMDEIALEDYAKDKYGIGSENDYFNVYVFDSELDVGNTDLGLPF